MIDIPDYDWITNPASGFKYDAKAHWTTIEDIIPEAGDIKYVWELSRFSFLYTAIRYDYHFEQDCSKWVFDKIASWIDANPINCGPNYKCSQEIGLRVLNWTFALYYYKDSEYLTEDLFQKIMHHINWQIQHVYDNINFSLKTVRNNHALAETTALYIVGMLYPFLPNAKLWKSKGKQWIEQEIQYQIYDDGAFLMFSMNYQRTAIQFFTWLLYLTNANDERLQKASYQRIYSAINLLYQSQDSKSGMLPNYGHNDGSLFCKLNDAPFRDFRSQLNAAYFFFNGQSLYDNQNNKEELSWYSTNRKKVTIEGIQKLVKKNLSSFDKGGYYIIKDDDFLTFIRCGSHNDRPSQADNLHFDLWYKGENLLRDAGTYKYNASPELVDYFSGTKAHNTIGLGAHDQMKKGPRFIWLNWTMAQFAKLSEQDNEYVFEGSIQAFEHIASGITHARKVQKQKGGAKWIITDKVNHDTQLPINQYWNISERFLELFEIFAEDSNGNLIPPEYSDGWYSGHYGKKEKSQLITFVTSESTIKTTIKLK